MKRTKIFLFCVIILALIKNVEAEEIRVFGDEINPPKVYLKDGKPRGILVEILKYVETRSKYRFKIELYPWKRAYHQAAIGTGGVIGLSMNKERFKIFDFSDIVYWDDIVIITAKDRPCSFSRIEDLKGMTIGVQRGASYGDEFERGKNGIFKVYEDNRPEQRFKRLLAHRIDAAIIGPGAKGFFQILKKYPELYAKKGQFVVHPIPFYRDPNYLGFAKTQRMNGFLNEFNQIIREGYQSGKIQAIIEKAY